MPPLLWPNWVLSILKYEFYRPSLVSDLLFWHYSKSKTRAILTLDNPLSTKSAKVSHALNTAQPLKQKLKSSTAVAKVKPKHNKFVEEANALLSPQIPIWLYCMASIDQQVFTQKKLAYFVSKPVLIIELMDNTRKL